MLYVNANESSSAIQVAEKRGVTVVDMDRKMWFFPFCQELRERISSHAPEFPCTFARTALHRGTLIYTGIEDLDQDGFDNAVLNIRQFLRFYHLLNYRSALVVFLDTRHTMSLDEDEEIFWSLVRYIEQNSSTRTSISHNDHRWQFHFDDHHLFFNGHSPHYKHRFSRSSPHCLVVIIQTKQNLEGISGISHGSSSISEVIRSKVDEYDLIPRSPYLKLFGDHENLEWRQYWLLDSNCADDRKCPLNKENPNHAEED